MSKLVRKCPNLSNKNPTKFYFKILIKEVVTSVNSDAIILLLSEIPT